METDRLPVDFPPRLAFQLFDEDRQRAEVASAMHAVFLGMAPDRLSHVLDVAAARVLLDREARHE